MRLFLSVLVVFCLFSLRPALAREWTDSSGTHKVEAELVKLDGEVVHLKKTDSTIVKVSLNKLSTEDQAFVRQQVAPNAAGVVGEKPTAAVQEKPAAPDQEKPAAAQDTPQASATDVAELQKVNAACRSILDSPAATPVAKGNVLKWGQCVKTRDWGDIKARYVGIGKNADGTWWVQVQDFKGEKKVLPYDDLDAASQQVLKDIRQLKFAILKDAPQAVANEKPKLHAGADLSEAKTPAEIDPIVVDLLKPTSTVYDEAGFKEYKFDATAKEVQAITPFQPVEMDKWFGAEDTGFYFVGGKLKGIRRAYRDNNEAYAKELTNVFGRAPRDNVFHFVTDDWFSRSCLSPFSIEPGLHRGER